MSESKPLSTRPDDVVFERRTARIRFGEILYTLRGIASLVVAFLRVPLRIQKGDGVHLDRVDLSSARGRRKFAETAGRKLDVPPARVEEQLLGILEVLSERERDELEKADRPLFAPVPKLTESEREAALGYLARADLLGTIEGDLGKLGYVGEVQAKRLVYLVALSRKLASPLAAIIRSSSGSGKSALLELVTRISPPEDVVFLSELTPQALYYLDPGALKHKLLVVDERAGSERADYPIRTLLSHQALSLAVTISDPTSGQRRTKLVEVEGPVAYLESTTIPVLNPENTSRALEVFLEESSEQTRRIQEAQRERRVGRGASPSENPLVALHRNVQRCLSMARVEIPFARHLSFPSELPRHRRDHEKFLRLIEAVAFLHQHRRERHGDALVATLEDYRVAYELARPVLARSTETLSAPAREALEILRDRELLEFTRRDLSRALGWAPIRVWRVIQELLRADFAVPLPAQADRRRRYRALEFYQEGTDTTRLLPPEELARRLGDRTIS